MQRMDKKFVDSKILSNYEILTDDGFKDVCALHKTIEYDVYKLELETKEIKCADNHIVFLSDDTEIFVKNLNIGDVIKTDNGLEKVMSVINLGYKKNMWDFELCDDNVKYYTNGILSHNTTIIRKIINNLSEDKTIIYVPSYMMDSIADPSFISFIGGIQNAILLLEDAENILANTIDNRSQAVSNILNMTDGLLNDYMNVQIIATFNTNAKMIDAALKRAGRLQVNYKFGKLTKTEANKLAQAVGIDKVFDSASTLAEIYEGTNQIIEDDLAETKIGFRK